MEYQPELCPTLEEVHEIYGERCNDILHELDLHEVIKSILFSD